MLGSVNLSVRVSKWQHWLTQLRHLYSTVSRYTVDRDEILTCNNDDSGTDTI